MFFSGDILAREGHHWIRPFLKEQVVGAAYEMRMGDEAYVSFESPHDRKPTLLQLQHKQQVDIPAGQFAFLLTREYITVPYDLMAFINMKNGLKSRGLVNVSGFHVDPGYAGRLVFSVYNAGPKRITIRENDPAFLIWFSRLEGATGKYARTKPGFNHIDSDLIAQIPEESSSFNSLRNRIEKLEQILSWRHTAMAYVLGVVTTVVLSGVSGWALGFFGGSSSWSMDIF